MILYVPPNAPTVVKDVAALILALHIGGGGLGVLSGGAALVAPKGGRAHRIAGDVFFGAMLTMATIGAAASPFLPAPSLGNVVGGVFTIYLVTTGWLAVRRKAAPMSRLEIGLIFIPAATALVDLSLAFWTRTQPGGEIQGVPWQAMMVFGGVAALMAGSDLSVLLRRGVAGAQRLARHLWRMNVGLLIALGSALSQPRITHLLPRQDRTLPVLLAPVAVILVYMLFWLGKLAFVSLRAGARRRSTSRAGSYRPAIPAT
jgi:hypothetical protein